MSRFSRRRALVAAGCGVSGVLAGCFDESATNANGDDSSGDDSNGDDAGPLDDAVTADGEVDYPAFVGDDVVVDEESGTIEYATPDVEFTLAALLEDEDPTADELHVGRDLSTDVMGAFIAPAFDEDGDLTHHVFANEAFVEHADWYLVFLEGDDDVDERAASFDELDNGVYHCSASPPTDANITAIADSDYDGIASDDHESTHVGIVEQGIADPDSTPSVSFTVDEERHGDGTKTVQITHTSGDELEGDHVVADVGNETVANPFDRSTVAVGDMATLDDVPESAGVQLVYDDGDRETVLIAVGND